MICLDRFCIIGIMSLFQSQSVSQSFCSFYVCYVIILKLLLYWSSNNEKIKHNTHLESCSWKGHSPWWWNFTWWSHWVVASLKWLPYEMHWTNFLVGPAIGTYTCTRLWVQEFDYRSFEQLHPVARRARDWNGLSAACVRAQVYLASGGCGREKTRETRVVQPGHYSWSFVESRAFSLLFTLEEYNFINDDGPAGSDQIRNRMDCSVPCLHTSTIVVCLVVLRPK